jgi:hypothetical protein
MLAAVRDVARLHSPRRRKPGALQINVRGYLSSPDNARPAIERAAAENTKALLAGTIAKGGLGRAILNIPRNERKIAGAILACWSLVHGLPMLLADGLVGPRKKFDKLSDSVVQSMLDGLRRQVSRFAAWRLAGASAQLLVQQRTAQLRK